MLPLIRAENQCHGLSLEQKGMRSRITYLLCLSTILSFLLACPKTAPEKPASTDHAWIHLFVNPDSVEQTPRFRFRYEKAEAAAALRREEKLDDIVAGATSDEERCTLLMHWVRRQWDLSRPDPYPPPDARIILHDIRSGHTGGFCSQYAVVLVQSASSFNIPARFVTLYGHEVAEIWLKSQNQWVLFDPYNDLTITDENDKMLNAGQIRNAVKNGQKLRISQPNRLKENPSDYFKHYENFAVWLRNDLLAHPLNFSDFDRYRLWYDPEGLLRIPNQSLKTPFLLDLYQPPK